MKIEYHPPEGQAISDAARTAINTAYRMNCNVSFNFNDSVILVRPDSDVDSVIDKYKNTPRGVDIVMPVKTGVYEKIKKWVCDRRLHTADPKVQLAKAIEELGELSGAVLRDDKNGAIDGIGDVGVVLICLCEQLGLNFEECLTYAYDEIKDRKGRMVDGIFVKEEDLIDDNNDPGARRLN